MRHALTYAGWLLKFRPVVAGLLVAATVGVAAVGLLSVPNLMDDPMVPPTRLSLLLTCLAATLLVAQVQPLMNTEERLSSISIPAVRAGAVALITVPLVGVVVLLRSASTGSLAVGPAGVCMGLMGIALVCARVNVYLGLLAPWAYAMTGLTLGYQQTIYGRVSLQPWAWLVSPDDLALSWWLVALLALGISVQAVPRR